MEAIFLFLDYFAVTHSLSYFYLRQRTLDSIQSSFPAYNNYYEAAWKWTEQLLTNVVTDLRAGKYKTMIYNLKLLLVC
jgi:hypothetical protein